jgi:hypothetical protein
MKSVAVSSKPKKATGNDSRIYILVAGKSGTISTINVQVKRSDCITLIVSVIVHVSGTSTSVAERVTISSVHIIDSAR